MFPLSGQETLDGRPSRSARLAVLLGTLAIAAVVITGLVWPL